MSGETKTAAKPFSPRQPGEAQRVPCVEVRLPDHPTRVVRLELGTSLIGRSSRAQIQIEDDGLSRRHAKIVVGADGVAQVIDLESTNGTYVNGEKIDAVVLREGDRIQIGPDLELVYEHRRLADLEPRDAVASESIDLSPRELDVARLVAEGLSNAEVARKLSISPRTVTTHLSNIYARLGIKSRAALTRYIFQRGLAAP